MKWLDNILYHTGFVTGLLCWVYIAHNFYKFADHLYKDYYLIYKNDKKLRKLKFKKIYS